MALGMTDGCGALAMGLVAAAQVPTGSSASNSEYNVTLLAFLRCF